MPNDLEHSGVKGMKWYQHKYGRWQSHAEYAGGQPDPNAKEAKRREKILSSPRKLKKHYKEFSDEEIRRAIKNFETEQRLSQFTASEIKMGADILGNISKSTDALIKTYNGAASIYNAWTKFDKKLPIVDTKYKQSGKNQNNNDDDDSDEIGNEKDKRRRK